MIRVQLWKEGDKEAVHEMDCADEMAANAVIDAGATALWKSEHGSGIYSIIAFRVSSSGIYQSIYWQSPEPGIMVA